jgi:fluoroquinolone resistance protein
VTERAISAKRSTRRARPSEKSAVASCASCLALAVIAVVTSSVSELSDRLLSEASFEDQVFSGIDLPAAALDGKEFYRCTFRGAKLQQSRWTRSLLEDCTFDTCDLSGALPNQLALRKVAFRQCKLIGIDWSKLGNYPDVSFAECNLRYASFGELDLQKTLFAQCAMQECSFIRTNLGHAVFEACELNDARFDGCDLRAASFAQSVGVLVDPGKNKVQGMKMPLASAALLAASFGIKIV